MREENNAQVHVKVFPLQKLVTVKKKSIIFTMHAYHQFIFESILAKKKQCL